jgi:hypothetical protein
MMDCVNYVLQFVDGDALASLAPHLIDLGSILQNSISAENFLDEYSSSNLDKFPPKYNIYKFILSTYCGQQ